MRVTYDPKKRETTLRERGLDFEDAEIVFAGVTLEVEDTRREYGELESSATAYLPDAWWSSATRRVAERHVFSMRKANEREQDSIAPFLEV